MAWGTLADAEVAALIGTSVDVERMGVVVVVDVNDDRREAVA